MGLFYVLIFIGGALAIFGPFVFGFTLYKWVKARTGRRLIFLILASLFLPYCYLWYDAIYPNDGFYEEEFVKITKAPFPANGEIIKKSASYPDQHGDYASCAKIQVSPLEFDNLRRRLTNDSSFTAGTNEFVGSSEFSWVANSRGKEAFLSSFAKGDSVIGAYVFIGFYSDHKTIIVYRVSS